MSCVCKPAHLLEGKDPVEGTDRGHTQMKAIDPSLAQSSPTALPRRTPKPREKYGLVWGALASLWQSCDPKPSL